MLREPPATWTNLYHFPYGGAMTREIQITRSIWRGPHHRAKDAQEPRRYSGDCPARKVTTDKPSHCSKSIAALLLRSARAVVVGNRMIQMLSPSAEVDRVVITAEMQRQARYDIAVNTPPIGYHESSPTKLMYSQMWEKRASARFELLQLCPPHRKAQAPATA